MHNIAFKSHSYTHLPQSDTFPLKFLSFEKRRVDDRNYTLEKVIKNCILYPLGLLWPFPLSFHLIFIGKKKCFKMLKFHKREYPSIDLLSNDTSAIFHFIGFLEKIFATLQL